MGPFDPFGHRGLFPTNGVAHTKFAFVVSHRHVQRSGGACVSDNRQRHVSETANFGGTNASDILAAELGNLNAAVGRLRTELFRCQLDFGGGLLIVAELVLWLH